MYVCTITLHYIHFNISPFLPPENERARQGGDLIGNDEGEIEEEEEDDALSVRDLQGQQWPPMSPSAASSGPPTPASKVSYLCLPPVSF